jgi:surfeit locus 1 family protein
MRFWLATLATALALAATLSLGAWQLDRAAGKQALHAAIEERKGLEALDEQALTVTGNAAGLMHRPVVLRGIWLAQNTVFLDNRQMQGKPGFEVLTPLVLHGKATAVMVQRGWVQRDFTDRERLPPIDTPAGLVEVRGRIAPPPARLYEFAGSPAGAIRQNLDLGKFSAETRLPLRRDLMVQQIAPASGGLLRDWPAARSGVDKHYGYAFQWFALAVLIAILYVWFQFIAPRRTRRT